jgi:hypothetical protein
MFQGLAFWGGINQVVACRYTRGLGTQPDYAILEFIPQLNGINGTGNLSFTFAGNFVNLFRCRVDFGSMQWSSESGQTAIIKIWDRRWAWQAGGEIYGRYNVQYTDGSFDQTTVKTPQQLATLLLQAMGEGNFDVSALPNNARPFVDWDGHHPATELDRLCEKFGCRVCLRIGSDSVVIVRLGVGAFLPTANLFRFSQSVNIAETPDSLKVLGGVALYQSKLKLQAVGIDRNGEIKPIDNLTYKPSSGWSGHEYPFSVITNTQDRELAQKSVWRWYQIVSQADGTQNVPGYTDIQKIDNLKPINDYLVETTTLQNGRVESQPAFIEGVWWNTNAQFNTNTASGTKYNGDFSVRGEDGIVAFPEQIYQKTGASRSEAELYLTCSYNARDPNTLGLVRYVQGRNLGGNNGTGPLIIPREDIRFTSYAQYSGTQVTGIVTNQAQVQQDALAQLDASQLEFVPTLSFDAGYNGIMPIDVDGLTRQVTFKVDSRDRSERGGAETYVSVNCETDPYAPRHYERKSRRNAIRGRSGLFRGRGRP